MVRAFFRCFSPTRRTKMENKVILACLLLLLKEGPLPVSCDQATPPSPPTESKYDIRPHLFDFFGEGKSKSTTPKPDSCPMDWTMYHSSCYRAFTGSDQYFNFESAQEYCNTLGGYLATFDPQESLPFFDLDPENNLFHWWVGYRYHVHQNGSHWVLDGDSQMASADSALAAFEVDKQNVNQVVAEYCGQVRGNRLWFNQVILFAEQCSARANFLCKKDLVAQCLDRKGRPVVSGSRYLPNSNDPCVSCTCDNGQPAMCMAASCGAPNCQYYVSNPDVCCGFTCFDPSQTTGAPSDPDDPYGSDQSDWLRVDSSMRWVLTSTTSILILGFLLFTVHRLRQRRLAMLSYRNRARHMPTFGPGSGPPPPPDGESFTVGGAPPPYSFLKPDDEEGMGAPPAYDDILDGGAGSTETSLDQHSVTPTTPAPQLLQEISSPLRGGEVEEAPQVAFDALSTGSSLESTTQDDVPILGPDNHNSVDGGV